MVPLLSALYLTRGSHAKFRKLKTMHWKPASQKETSPLAHFVRNSLPHKSFRFCSPMLLWKPRSENQDLETKIWKPASVLVPSKLEAIALQALPTKPSLLSSLRIIHPLLILQVDCTSLCFVDLLTNLRCR